MGSNDPFAPVYPPEVPGPPSPPAQRPVPPNGRPWRYGLVLGAVLVLLALLFWNKGAATSDDRPAGPARVQPIDQAKPASAVLDTLNATHPDTSNSTVH